jgi:acetoacetate decarboxylase
MNLEHAKKVLTIPTVVLKIIPDVDGTIRIAELVRFEYSVTMKGAWTGLGGIDLFHHAAVPVAALPVREVVSVTHTYTDSRIGTSEVIYCYTSDLMTKSCP